MSSTLKKGNTSPSVPDWASFFNEQAYENFIGLIESYFRNQKVTFRIEDGIVYLKEAFHGLENLGLQNLAQRCNQAETKGWEEVISDHFGNLIEADIFEKEFEKQVENFDYVKQFIGLRLYHISYIEEVGRENVIGRKFSEDIFMMLVFDLPASVTSIKPEQAEDWGLPISQLFELGLNNIKRNYPVEISEVKFEDFKTWFATSDYFYTPNLVLDIENFPQLIGSKGSLITIPNRHSVFIYPVENLEVVMAINKLIPVTCDMNLEGPGSLSKKMFWYNDGKIEEQPYKLTEEKLEFFPSAAFLEVLNNLEEAK
jgi:hypothetical protein